MTNPTEPPIASPCRPATLDPLGRLKAIAAFREVMRGQEAWTHEEREGRAVEAAVLAYVGEFERRVGQSQ